MLARDRAGKKPLYYSRGRDFLVFASEIKSFFGRDDLPIEIDRESVPPYFIHGYVPCPRTIYRNVHQVEPATTITVHPDGGTTGRVYWRLQLRKASDGHAQSPGSHDAVDTVRRLMTEAVERRLISDVPLGAFLSGGLDSTIVVGLMSRLRQSPVRTFSIGFEGDPRYDETAYAREVAARFSTDHTEFRVTPAAIDLIDTLLWHHDGPFGDASAIPTYIVSRLTREHVTVVLTGDGGDELFAGYYRFAAALAAERLPGAVKRTLRAVLDRLPAGSDERHWIAKGQRFAHAMNLPLYERMTRWSGLFYDDLESLLAPDLLASVSPPNRLAYLDSEREQMRHLSILGALLHANFRSYLLDDLLVKTDRCTMAHSLEARSPFLDTGLVEYVVILRKAFADLLPRSVARRGKMGFGVPLGTWFRTGWRDSVRDVLLDSSAHYRPFLSAPYVRDLVTRHQSGEANLGLQLWSVLCFELWLRRLPQWTRQPAPVSA